MDSSARQIARSERSMVALKQKMALRNDKRAVRRDKPTLQTDQRGFRTLKRRLRNEKRALETFNGRFGVRNRRFDPGTVGTGVRNAGNLWSNTPIGAVNDSAEAQTDALLLKMGSSTCETGTLESELDALERQSNRRKGSGSLARTPRDLVSVSLLGEGSQPVVYQCRNNLDRLFAR